MLKKKLSEQIIRLLPPKSHVLCALSGGADSVAMTCALYDLRETAQIASLSCAHFNHGLRGAESDTDQLFCAKLCRKLGVTIYTEKAFHQEKDGTAGGEAEYRRLRYEFLLRTAAQHGATHIATAHTSDDNAETLLLNLVRGTGLSGLTGIPSKRAADMVEIIRPMLTVTRAEVLEYLDSMAQSCRVDATNHTDSYRRNRIRRHVMPLLRTENPKLSEALLRTSELLRRDSEYIEKQAEQARKSIASAPNAVSADGLYGLPAALSSRIVRQMCADACRETAWLSLRHIEAIIELCKSAPSASLDLPHSLIARRVYGNLILEKRSPEVTFKPVKINFGQRVLLEGTGLEASWTEKPKKINNLVYSFMLNSDTISGELIIRPRMEGDFISLSGRGITKTLRRMFIDRKIPKHERQGIPVLADETGVIAVCGFGVDERCSPKGKSTCLQIYREEQRGDATRSF